MEEHHNPVEVDECPDWVGWGEWWSDKAEGVWGGLDFGVAEFGTYALIAVSLPVFLSPCGGEGP